MSYFTLCLSGAIALNGLVKWHLPLGMGSLPERAPSPRPTHAAA
ncbi:hypothetical protein [Parathermosynechococcus lividus]